MSENPTAVPAKPDLVEAARKKRHAVLLRKLRDEGLSSREIAELARYEAVDTAGFDWRAMEPAQVCAALEISDRSLRRWVKQGCPYLTRNKVRRFDCAAVLKWRVERQRELDAVDGELGGADKSDTLEEYRRVKTASARFDLEVKMGEHVTCEDVERVLRTMAGAVRRGLQAVGAKISTLLSQQNDANAAAAILGREIEDTLHVARRHGD